MLPLSTEEDTAGLIAYETTMDIVIKSVMKMDGEFETFFRLTKANFRGLFMMKAIKEKREKKRPAKCCHDASHFKYSQVCFNSTASK